MKYLSIRLKALSPLAVRSDHAAEGAQMTQYIPGTTLLGSLAATYKLLHPERTARFEQLFLSGEVSFPNLYPASYKQYEKQEIVDLDLPVYPCPKTALTCKRHKGFLYPDVEENDGHGVCDSLIARAIFSEWMSAHTKVHALDATDQDFAFLSVLDDIKACPKCAEPADRYDGYYRRLRTGSLLASDNYTHLQTHTGINRSSGTVEEGVLYNRQVFDEGTQFWGQLKVADDAAYAELTTFLDEVGDDGIVRVGTGRSRGMGKVQLYYDDMRGISKDFAEFQKRLNTFDKSLKDKASEPLKDEAGKPLKNKNGKPLSLDLQQDYYFALTLHSPAILCDELLRYRSCIDAEALRYLLAADTNELLAELTLVYQRSSVQRIAGWQELWGTPRAIEHAIEAGSVFLFKCPSAQREVVQKALYSLEEQGIGKRRLEGFGRICVSDEFHQGVSWS